MFAFKVYDKLHRKLTCQICQLKNYEYFSLPKKIDVLILSGEFEWYKKLTVN